MLLRPAIAAAPLACCLLAAGCASTSVGNAPPAVVEECRQEVADLTDRDRLPPLDESLPEEAGPEAAAIEEARAAKREQRAAGIESWPEDALLYRCFTSRGVVLTEEQAAVLAEWQTRTEAADPE